MAASSFSRPCSLSLLGSRDVGPMPDDSTVFCQASVLSIYVPFVLLHGQVSSSVVAPIGIVVVLLYPLAFIANTLWPIGS